VYHPPTMSSPSLRALLFGLVALLHILIWVFVLTAFVHRTSARINLYYVVPCLYVIHMLPFHLLERLKLHLTQNDEDAKRRQMDQLEKALLIPFAFRRLQTTLDSACTFNPISDSSAPRFAVSVDLPTPPFELQIVAI